MGILLQNLSQFEANDYSESSPHILSEVRVRLDHYFDRQADTELIVLTDDKSPTRLLAGMILPTRKAYFPVADWPVAESWEEAATVLAFYAKHVAAQSPGRPSLVLKASGGESRVVGRLNGSRRYCAIGSVFRTINDNHATRSTLHNPYRWLMWRLMRLLRYWRSSVATRRTALSCNR